MILRLPLHVAGLGLLLGASAPAGSEQVVASATREAAEPVTALIEAVTREARERAAAAYVAAEPIPEGWRKLDYDAHRDIRFRSDSALRADHHEFEVQLFHAGYLFARGVDLHVVRRDTGDADAGINTPEAAALASLDVPGLDLPGFAVDPVGSGAYFDYGPIAREQMSANALSPEDGAALPPAGFRLYYPLNDDTYPDEFLVFLGASYFRFLGRGHAYGLSARGAAVNAAFDEEFPDFRAFWLVPPDPRHSQSRQDTALAGADPSIDIVALLDSPSLTGAYHFRVSMTDPVHMEVEARLFARETIDNLGVAPLTSMYWFGDGEASRHDDFRPRVHDSDALQIHGHDGEWILRPLINPAYRQVTRFLDVGVRGFGLLQQPRDLDDFQDAEALYHRRPGMWVEFLDAPPHAGGVELMELPTRNETFDNIVAYWTESEPFRAGDERHYRYRLTPIDRHPAARLAAASNGAPLALVSRTAMGHAGTAGADIPDPRRFRRVVIDFTDPPRAARSAVSASGAPIDSGTSPNPDSGSDSGSDTSRGSASDAMSGAAAIPDVVIQGDAARVIEQRIERIAPDTLRVTLDVDLGIEPGGLADLRVFLERGGIAVSESWSSLVTAPVSLHSIPSEVRAMRASPDPKDTGGLDADH